MKWLSAAITWTFISISYAAFVGDMFVKDDSSLAPGGDDGSSVLWPGGRVYYRFDGKSFRSKKGQDMVLRMMKYIETQFKLPSSGSCIVFENIGVTKKSVNDYILITGKASNGPDCFSQVGRKTGEQKLNLEKSCLKPELVLHALIHSLGFSHEMLSDYDNINGVNTGLTPYDSSSILMFNPADTVAEPGKRYHKPPYMSWPGTTNDDLLSTIDKVEIAAAYGCQIGQALMLDYVNLNRLSLEARLESITKKNNGGNSDKCKCQDQMDKLGEQIRKQEEQMNKQGEQIRKQEEQNGKQGEQIRKLEEQNGKQEGKISKLEEMEKKLREMVLKVSDPCTGVWCL